MDNELNQAMDAMWLQVKQATDNIFKRDLTHEEFFYLMSCYPYLEICDADYPYLDQKTKPEIIQLANGWQIFDFKSVLVSSASELQQRRRYPRPGAIIPPDIIGNEEEGEQGSGGTIVNQYAVVAEQMIILAQQKGWTAAEIISGFYPMQRIAWIISQERHYPLKGFSAGPEDYVIANWIQRLHRRQLYIPEQQSITTLTPE